MQGTQLTQPSGPGATNPFLDHLVARRGAGAPEMLAALLAHYVAPAPVRCVTFAGRLEGAGQG